MWDKWCLWAFLCESSVLTSFIGITNLFWWLRLSQNVLQIHVHLHPGTWSYVSISLNYFSLDYSLAQLIAAILDLSSSALMLSSVGGPEPHWATWRIYDRLELHTWDFSLNRSISRCAQALNKSPWGEHIKKRHASLWGVCPTPTWIKGIQLHSCMCTDTEDIVSAWCINPLVQLQHAWLDGVVLSEANLKTTGLCPDPLIPQKHLR